jgi:hypothetical protein
MAVFADRTYSDPEVETDVCYATLSEADPWEEESARDFRWAVGRLPVGAGWDAEALVRYLGNRDAALAQGTPRGMTYGLSARRWERASQAVMQSLGGGMVHTSPRLDHETLLERWDCRSSWQYFNLHGAMEEPAWYGEDAGDYPVAFLPSLVRHLEPLNVIGVEACYGARFAGLDPASSILLAALSQQTVAFLGSSRIAFGPHEPPNHLADVMVRDFLQAMRQGAPAGFAHQHARQAVAAGLQHPDMDPDLVMKTLLSFNLFGDPTAGLGLPASGVARLAASPQVSLRETLAPVRQALTASLAETEQRLQALLAGRYPELREVRPRVTPVAGSANVRHRWHWQAKTGPLLRHWVVLTDASGQVRGEFESR